MLCRVKSYSVHEAGIALSSGGAELYATSKAATEPLGPQSLSNDLGVDFRVRRLTDSSTSNAINRRGLGKLRHIANNELRLQEEVVDKEAIPIKTKNV